MPFDAIADLSELRIRVLDTTRLTGLPTGPDALAGLFDAPAATAVEMADLGLDAMRRHRDFIGVAGQIGWVLDPGRFEIAGEAACGFRWRLRRADGQVVAESAKAHASRADCEDEIRWVRRYAPLASIGSLDLPGSTCRAER